jgi:hypothetical protein
MSATPATKSAVSKSTSVQSSRIGAPLTLDCFGAG